MGCYKFSNLSHTEICSSPNRRTLLSNRRQQYDIYYQGAIQDTNIDILCFTRVRLRHTISTNNNIQDHSEGTSNAEMRLRVQDVYGVLFR